ncbi:MAG: D-alanine--D-alanine ligase family protein [Anaerolineae bacterium]
MIAERERIRVAVLFGGKSGEHEVSIASARSVMRAIDGIKYDVRPIAITKQGRWLAGEEAQALLQGDAGSLLAQKSAENKAGRTLALEEAAQSLFDIDVVFPVLHGTYGEDGTVQGLLELVGLPYVGAGVLGSALGLDKIAAKDVLRANGVPVVPGIPVQRSRWSKEPNGVLEDAERRFGYPMFVKPANMGSSVGVAKAHDPQELARALDMAARYDRRMLVEPAINAREIECSVLGNDDPVASVPGEVVPCNEFYDYNAKYVDGSSVLHIPADIPEEMAESVRSYAVRAFLAIDCAGMARVDFFLCRDTGNLYVNELNTIPGFTDISMYPKLWEASGIPYSELIDRLIALAFERWEQRQACETSYHALPRRG